MSGRGVRGSADRSAANRVRDWRVSRTLRKSGWRALRIWEHELARKREARLAAKLRAALEG